ncbi:MAG: LemA family protein [Bacteroidetes bacterium 24-39-8]|jgi:LemA protein|nr:MAG: LemA family protein [Sphingobacteriia bacterium 35-40-8]OYZ49256.1 MAG: LemA family protein [Bacteroidetes bacterium 24-39-8]HQR93830.1 LemA family protein [Sediminibacterium sp.]HQS56058.1 LemA family protein [Sediminibacterium sp.]
MNTKNLTLIVIAALVLLLGGCGCSGYNGLVQQDETVKKAWNNVQSDYQRRSDLIPNLVSTVKGEANFEQTTLTNVIQARASATQIKLDAKDLSPEKIKEFQAAQGQLSQALGKLMVLTENYPTLRANEAFRGLQAQLEGTENRIKVARNDFNAAVADYNIKARSFPMNILAGLTGFKPKEGFQAEAGSEKAPEVKF